MNLTQNERDSLDDVFNSICAKNCKFKIMENASLVVNKKIQLFYRHLFKEFKFAN